MINWPSIYIASWGALFGALIVSFYSSSKKARRMFDTYVESIQSKNADLGLNRSVSEKELALDYLLPHRDDRLERYSKNNDIKKNKYIDILDEDVGKPKRLFAFIGLIALSLLIGFLGPIIYSSTGLTFIAEYLVVFLFILLVNLVAYFIL